MANSEKTTRDNETQVFTTMTDFTGLYDIRDMQELDKNFIIASFLNGNYYGNSWFNMIDKSVFMQNYKQVIEHFINSPNFTVKIACPSDDHSIIIGYSILSADYQGIMWVYVKKDWRNKRVGTNLLPQFPTYVTHLTDSTKDLVKQKFPNIVFNPFAIK